MRQTKFFIAKSCVHRRDFLAGAAALTLAASPRHGHAQSSKSGTVRVWGEPGPYGGVAVAAMNEWAQKNAPGLKFEIETIPWDGVYVKLMTDLAARRPPGVISVESPIAMQLMADEPLDDVAQAVGRDRLADKLKWEYFGAWKGKQYIMPAHHQPHLLLVRTDVIKEFGLSDPDTWTWSDLANAARIITQKKPDMAGICMALGRNLCTDYHFAALLHQAGGKMFDQSNRFEIAFDSPETAEALEFVRELQQFMPKGAVEYSFLQVVDAHVTGKTAMSFYWGTLGRAAEEAKPIFEATEAFNHARNPRTGRRSNWNDFQGWCIPARNNPFVEEAKQALTYYEKSTPWLVKYCHSLMPNVAPVFKDQATSAELRNHPFYQTKARAVDTYFNASLEHASSTANELLQGVNPFAGIVHGRSILAQNVQKVVIDKLPAREAAKWGARELETVRKENMQLVN